LQQVIVVLVVVIVAAVMVTIPTLIGQLVVDLIAVARVATPRTAVHSLALLRAELGEHNTQQPDRWFLMVLDLVECQAAPTLAPRMVARSAFAWAYKACQQPDGIAQSKSRNRLRCIESLDRLARGAILSAGSHRLPTGIFL
jgi:hypothetical protein